MELDSLEIEPSSHRSSRPSKHKQSGSTTNDGSVASRRRFIASDRMSSAEAKGINASCTVVGKAEPELCSETCNDGSMTRLHHLREAASSSLSR